MPLNRSTDTNEKIDNASAGSPNGGSSHAARGQSRIRSSSSASTATSSTGSAGTSAGHPGGILGAMAAATTMISNALNLSQSTPTTATSSIVDNGKRQASKTPKDKLSWFHKMLEERKKDSNAQEIATEIQFEGTSFIRELGEVDSLGQ